MSIASHIWFDVHLYPHRSLSERGFFILMGFVCTISFCAGLAFFLLGAWPVVGFLGLDVLGIYWAFKVNYRDARTYETILLTDDELIVRHVSADQRTEEWRFHPWWVRVKVYEYNGTSGEMLLTSHGREVRIGSFLNDEERASLAGSLQKALHLRQENITGHAHNISEVENCQDLSPNPRTSAIE